MARISGLVAEPIVTLPASEAVGRISGLVAEAIVTLPTAEAVGRLSGLVAEPIVTEAAAEMRTSFVFVEVFSESPGRGRLRNWLGGGVQGTETSRIE